MPKFRNCQQSHRSQQQCSRYFEAAPSPAPKYARRTLGDGHGNIGHGTVCSSVQRRYKAVPSLRNGFNVERMLGIIAERSSNLPDGEVEPSLIIDESLRAPNLLNNLVPGDGF